MTDSGALDALRAQLAQSPLAGRVSHEFPLGPLTTYRVGGTAALGIALDTRADLDGFLAAYADAADAVGDAAARVPVLVVGRGSNLLVADAGFGGVALTLGAGFADVSVDGEIVTAGAAAKLPVVARTCATAGLRGFEWAVGVPGSVGGAVRMNAGGHGADMADSLVDVDIARLTTGAVERVPAADLDLAYRSTAITADDVVASARLQLAVGDAAAAKAEMMEVVQWRRQHQPGGQNAGSVFTNPPGDSAGRLIDTAGLKGLRIGSAEVSTKHANFIQADAGGNADDVFALMAEIIRRVAEFHGIELHAETHLIGFDADH